MDFLDEIAHKLLSAHPESLRDVWVVLPGKRAGLFLKESIRKIHGDKPIWLPRILSIDEFIKLHCPYGESDKIQTLFQFYQVYRHDPEHTDTLDQFLNWAPTILSDFDDCDRYLVDAKQLYSNLQSVKELENWPIDDWSYTATQLKPLQTEFLSFWNKLYQLYKDLNEVLIENGISRTGMIYRDVAQNPEERFKTVNFHKVYFCGLNAVSESELQIMKYLVTENKADVFWEIHPDLIKDTTHEASYFVSRNLQTVGENLYNPGNQSLPEIHVHGSSNFYSQALIAAGTLQKSTDRRTAIILCDETLLEPIQKHLPELDNPVNITTEFPLRRTSVFNFFKNIVHLNIKRINSGSNRMYYKDMLDLIQHPVFKYFFSKGFDSGFLTSVIHKKNLIYLDPSLKDFSPETGIIISELFNAAKNQHDIAGLINSGLSAIERMMMNDPEILVKEQLYHLSNLYGQLKQLLENTEEVTIQTFLAILKQLLYEHNLSYKGEPLAGLQIMGMLETRSLNFDKVVLVGANEGFLPQSGQIRSFIPFDLRNYFKMPGRKNKEAIHAYYFYRQLWRSKEVHIIYNADKSGADPREPSRYIYQLKYEKIYPKVVTHFPMLKSNLLANPVVVEKDDHVMALIKQYLSQGLSPSAINKFLNCPTDFFHRYILRLNEMEEAEEDIQDSTFGSILHSVLESFYKNAIGKPLQIEFYSDFKKKLTELLIEAFTESNFSAKNLIGRNKLIFNICEHYLHSFVGNEKSLIEAGNKLEILELEQNIKVPINIGDYESEVIIKGAIDRVDRFNGDLRIMDYKTGSVKKLTRSASPEEAFVNQDRSKELQLMVYGWMYAKKHNIRDFRTGIFYLRQPTDPMLLNKTIDTEMIVEVENELVHFVQNLIDPNLPFTETPLPKYSTLLGYQQ